MADPYYAPGDNNDQARVSKYGSSSRPVKATSSAGRRSRLDDGVTGHPASTATSPGQNSQHLLYDQKPTQSDPYNTAAGEWDMSFFPASPLVPTGSGSLPGAYDFPLEPGFQSNTLLGIDSDATSFCAGRIPTPTQRFLLPGEMDSQQGDFPSTGYLRSFGASMPLTFSPANAEQPWQPPHLNVQPEHRSTNMVQGERMPRHDSDVDGTSTSSWPFAPPNNAASPPYMLRSFRQPDFSKVGELGEAGTESTASLGEYTCPEPDCDKSYSRRCDLSDMSHRWLRPAIW